MFFSKIQRMCDNKLIGVNCAAHICNNCICTDSECLPIDIEVILVKIYSYFYIYTIRVENFKEICDDVDVQYHKLLGYSETRWLTLLPALEKILKLFHPLKLYFLEQEKCPTILKTFFNNPFAEAWLFFIHSQAYTFHIHILKIESQNISMCETSHILKELKLKLIERKQQEFLPMNVKKIILELEIYQSHEVKLFKENV